MSKNRHQESDPSRRKGFNLHVLLFIAEIAWELAKIFLGI